MHIDEGVWDKGCCKKKVRTLSTMRQSCVARSSCWRFEMSGSITKCSRISVMQSVTGQRITLFPSEVRQNPAGGCVVGGNGEEHPIAGRGRILMLEMVVQPHVSYSWRVGIVLLVCV